MGDRVPRLVTRARLAEYACTSRAAVTNWHKRHNDFPEPVDGTHYDLGAVIAWLSSRTVPAGKRLPHEPPGTTYGDRVRANAGHQAPGNGPAAPGDARDVPPDIDRLLVSVLDRLRGRTSEPDGALLVAALIYVRAEQPARWKALRSLASRVRTDAAAFTVIAERSVPRSLVDVFRRTGPDALSDAVLGVDAIDADDATPDLLRAVFDRCLSSLEHTGAHGEPLRTPSSVVRAMVEMVMADTAPKEIHDPHCRAGEFLLAADQSRPASAGSVPPAYSGAMLDERFLDLAKLNTGIHGLRPEFGHAQEEWDRGTEAHTVDVVLGNPPFNRRMHPAMENTHPRYRQYGDPPKNNANFHWLQYAVGKLSPKGRAAILMADNASTSTNAKESAIRSAMVEDGVVECVAALPDRLFATTAIPVTLWILRPPTGRCENVLFIDARGLGEMVSRTTRALRDEDIEAVLRTYRAWRSGKPGDAADREHHRLGRAVPVQEVRDRDYSLHPPSYVLGQARHEDPHEHTEALTLLVQRLGALEAEVPKADARAERLVREVERWIH
jgi:type I restriction enzyme M protein